MTISLQPNPYGAYADVKAGSLVKLAFCDGMDVERMWVRIVCVSAGSGIYAGRLDTWPFFIELKRGDAVLFRKEHIHQIFVG